MDEVMVDVQLRLIEGRFRKSAGYIVVGNTVYAVEAAECNIVI